jgi:hypothetical protein
LQEPDAHLSISTGAELARSSRQCVFLITATCRLVGNPDVEVHCAEYIGQLGGHKRLQPARLGRRFGNDGLQFSVKVSTMDRPASATSRVAYGRKLVSAGISGIRNGSKTINGGDVSALVADSARDSLKLAAAGACLGLLPALLTGRRPRLSSALAFGALGSVLGFVAGFTWKTREVTSNIAHSAARELHRVGDERWLERHPIDYA